MLKTDVKKWKTKKLRQNLQTCVKNRKMYEKNKETLKYFKNKHNSQGYK